MKRHGRSRVRHNIKANALYVAYFHEDRTHLSLIKDTPDKREITPKPSASAKVIALPHVGGVHHRYEWKEAA